MATLHYLIGTGWGSYHIGSFELKVADTGLVELGSWRVINDNPQARSWRARVDTDVFTYLEGLFRKAGRPVERPMTNLVPDSSRQQVVAVGGSLDGWNLVCDWDLDGETEQYRPLLHAMESLVEQVSGYAVGNAVRIPLPVVVHDRELLEDSGWGDREHTANVNVRCSVVAVGRLDGRVAIKSFDGDTRLVLDTGVRGPVAGPFVVRAGLAGYDGLLVATGAFDGSVWAWDPAGRPLVQGWGARPGAVRQMAPLSGGLVAVATDTGVILWDAGEQREVWRLRRHEGAVSAVVGVAGSDGLLASGGDDGVVRVWAVSEGRELAGLTGHAGWVERLASYVLHGRRSVVASGGADGVVRVWDPVEGSLLGTSGEGAGAVRALHYVGQELVAGHADGVVRLHEPGTGRAVATVSSGGAGVECVASTVAAGGGWWLAAGRRDGQVEVWQVDGDIDHGVQVKALGAAQPHEDWVTCLDLTDGEDGPEVVSGAIDGTRARWWPGTEPVVQESTQPLTLVAWDEPDGRVQAWGTMWGFVMLRRSDGREVDLLQIGETGAVAVVEHHGRRFVVAGGMSGAITQWDITDVWDKGAAPPNPIPITGHGWSPQVAGFSKEEGAGTPLMVTWTVHDGVRLWNAATGQVLRETRINHFEPVEGAFGVIHGRPVVALGSARGEVRLAHISMEMPQTLEYEPGERLEVIVNRISAMAFSLELGGTGTLLGVGGSELWVCRWDPEPRPAKWVRPEKEVVAVAFGVIHERQVLVGAAYEGTLYAMDVRTGRIVWEGAVEGEPLGVGVEDSGRIVVYADGRVQRVQPEYFEVVEEEPDPTPPGAWRPPEWE